MPDPASRKILLAFKALIDPIMGAQNTYIDLSDDEPLAANKRPAIALRIVSIDYDVAPDGMSQTMHRATLQCDCFSDATVSQAIDQKNQETIARIMERIGTDPVLGGRLQDINATGSSGSEMDGADTGCAILELAIIYFTPRYNYFTIVGHGGQTF